MTAPLIDYLAKDYASFRSQMLDALAERVPAWKQGPAADLGVAVVEILAYAADYLSYFQDAVATEAYLETARRRISLRRHARLLDYRISEGTNARVWVAAEVFAPVILPRGTRLLTRAGNLPPVLRPDSEELRLALTGGAEVFETMFEKALWPRHNQLRIDRTASELVTSTGEARGVLLRGHHPRLRPGDVLLFAAPPGTEGGTGQTHAVRLVAPPSLNTGGPRPVTEIRWFDEDAVPVSFLRQPDLRLLGNVILADHGSTVSEELPEVPHRGSYEPILKERPITFCQPLGPAGAALEPAVETLLQEPPRALPAVALSSLSPKGWAGSEEACRVRYDLLESDRFARDFVVEIDDQGRGHLRFGDGVFGRRPRPGARFRARYRVGNGSRGNVGPETLVHVVTDLEGFERVFNPAQAQGGRDPESNDQVRLRAPVAFHRQLRCVAPEDYVAVARRQRGVVAASVERDLVSTGNTARVYVQRPGGRAVDDAFRHRIERAFEPFLLLGTHLVVCDPVWVGLEIVLSVRCGVGVRWHTLHDALQRAFAAVLRPERYTLGEPALLDPLLDQARGVAGVAAVEATVYERWSDPAASGLLSGRIDIGESEVATVRNEPARPDLGSIRFVRWTSDDR